MRCRREGYSTNYLIDVENAIIVDVEATTAISRAEVLAAKRVAGSEGDTNFGQPPSFFNTIGLKRT
jgi:hypothetical protein